MLRHLSRSQLATIAAACLLGAVAAAVELLQAPETAKFVVSGFALAGMAAAVGLAVEQLGERAGPSATGLLQSTLGNLPELFVGIFALESGLVVLVKAALVGSILGNALLVLGFAFAAGGLRHGPQRFDPSEPRMNAALLLLAVGALLVPTLAYRLNTPAAPHSAALSNATAVVLLIVYAGSIPYYLRRRDRTRPENHARSADTSGTSEAWPLSLSFVVLAGTSLGAAFVSDWFVEALKPATRSLGFTEVFTGLVVVAIASNAVEHAVGIRFALKAKPEFALSTTLNSPLQVALLLTPVLVILSNFVGPRNLTLVFPPLMIASLSVAAVVVVAVIYDGEFTWLEGIALIGLYVIIAASFWWG